MLSAQPFDVHAAVRCSGSQGTGLGIPTISAFPHGHAAAAVGQSKRTLCWATRCAMLCTVPSRSCTGLTHLAEGRHSGGPDPCQRQSAGDNIGVDRWQQLLQVWVMS